MASNATFVSKSGEGQARFSSKRLKKFFGYLVLWILSFLSLYPLAVMVLNSFKTDTEINGNPSGIPENFTLENYTHIFAVQGGLIGNFMNGIIIALITTVVSVFLAAMAAFAFSKYSFKGRNIIFAFLLSTMMVPHEITIPPLFLIFSKLGWVNTFQGMIVPGLVSVFGLFMLRQYMLGVPNEIFEAARIDGAGHWRLFWSIMVPIANPAIASLSILQFLGTWNSYLWPIIIAPDPSIQPIMAVLPTIRDQQGYAPLWATIMTGCVLATLPVILVFVIFQDKFISGVTVGAVK
jgi:ABC-type glycerol-3-phosphate transport system permease component